MSKKRSGGSSQPELFARSTRPTIPIESNHRLVLLAEQTNWTELEARAEEIRLSKVKNAAGRPPHMRASLGATPAALLCAINDALSPLGLEITETPASPHRLWKLLRQAGAR